MGSKNKNTLPSLSSFTVKRAGRSGMSNFTGAILPSPDGLADNSMSFPDFSIMTCQQLEEQINAMKSTLAAESLVAKNAQWVASYEAAIKTATGYYDSKGCSLSSPDGGIKQDVVVINTTDNGTPVKIGTTNADTPAVVTTTTTVGTTTSGTPVVSTATTSATKKFPWLLIAGIAVVGYVLFAGQRSSGA